MIARLRQALPNLDIRQSNEDLKRFGTDWTRFYRIDPLAIVFPTHVEEVQTIVKLANETNTPLVPSGGRTGLSGGAVASNKELVVAFDRMNTILHYEETDRTAVIQAGVITEELQNFAEEKGWYYPVDFASKGSSQLGGNIATNAGGIRVVRYGMTRDWVVGLKVVTGKGEVLSLNNGLIKNATGYDLRHLFIGSEGTLGFIVEATIRFTRKPPPSTVFLLGIRKLEDVNVVLQLISSRFELQAFEFLSEVALQHVLHATQRPHPFDNPSPYYVLVELETSQEDQLDEIAKVLETCYEKGWVEQDLLAQTIQEKAQTWQYREEISASIASFVCYKNDISITPSKLAACLKEIEAIVNNHYPTFEIVWFGHIADGNLHLNILKPSDLPIPAFEKKCKTVNTYVFEIVKKYEGSISAEHGVGLLKRDYLHYTRSKEELMILKQIKSIFDPNGIMNPGKLIE